jgi:hypothetical protein
MRDDLEPDPVELRLVLRRLQASVIERVPTIATDILAAGADPDPRHGNRHARPIGGRVQGRDCDQGD